MGNSKKQISFDLDTKALQVYCPLKSWNNAYNLIKQHMEKNNFLWQQGSVYTSVKPMSSKAVTIIINKLIENNKWLNLCMRDCRETNIGKEHSKNYLFDKTAKIPTREELETKSSQDASSLKEWKKQINELKNSSNNSVDKIAAKDLHKKER
jgi:hypothetical protein